MTNLDHLTSDLPDAESARRFLSSLEEQHRSDALKLKKNEGLLSDVLTLVAYSPLLATTLLQNPEYIWWLNRKRRAPGVRTKDELMEALGRFMLTHSQLDLHTQLARFRRRELLRIFLGDIRRVATIAEITEDISNLADAILETALRRARQEMDNRYGRPQAFDDKGRKTTAEFCIVSLGKLGSRELNYSSDIDLLFLYSVEGETSATGTRDSITNREYFIKLSEAVVQLVGKQTGEGAAYRVDMRLRPHGRVGPLAISIDDAVRYYTGEARDWERQVLIRSRASAGEAEIFKTFFERVEHIVFVSARGEDETKTSPPYEEGVAERSEDETESSPPYEGGVAERSEDGVVNSSSHPQQVAPIPHPENHPAKASFVRDALESVRRSKNLIDLEQKTDRGFNVKLGRGGIREIEFIAQALQLAYGGADRWLRAPHTLISLSRLADRDLITESELTELFNAYEFLRHLEHVLQMENGLQTHIVPIESDRRALVARRMRTRDIAAFDNELMSHTSRVRRAFDRVFGEAGETEPVESDRPDTADESPVTDSTKESTSEEFDPDPNAKTRAIFVKSFGRVVEREREFGNKLGAFRRRWSAWLNEIKRAELENRANISQSKKAQTALAEASIETALHITTRELESRYKIKIDRLPLAVMGLGKLGGGAIDYESDLDLVLVYDDRDTSNLPTGQTPAEFYGRAAEIFVTTLSSMTRDGSIYRVDLRLRPYGKNGQSVISAAAFADYMRDTAAIWEWLAYVKIRGVAGDVRLAERVETELRAMIHERASMTTAAGLAEETRGMRLRLEKEKAGRRRSKDIDIKYGSGGLLDVYFAMRFLQLRDNVPDTRDNRSTERMLTTLRDRGSIDEQNYQALLEGYRFLSALDHNLRLVVGRTTRLPSAHPNTLDAVAHRMDLESHTDLLEHLTIHRLQIRKIFDELVA